MPVHVGTFYRTLIFFHFCHRYSAIAQKKNYVFLQNWRNVMRNCLNNSPMYELIWGINTWITAIRAHHRQNPVFSRRSLCKMQRVKGAKYERQSRAHCSKRKHFITRVGKWSLLFKTLRYLLHFPFHRENDLQASIFPEQKINSVISRPALFAEIEI